MAGLAREQPKRLGGMMGSSLSRQVQQPANNPFGSILGLSRTIGNRAVQRLLHSGVIRAKLTVSQPGDQYEQEADRVAEAMMHMPEPGAPKETTDFGRARGTRIQRLCTECEEEEKTLQAKMAPGHTPEITPDVEAPISAMRGGGQPLPHSVRAFFEPRFGYDFSQVRIHTDALATESAQAVNARAYTVGRDIVFGGGQYALASETGKRLVAHELTHVVQQSGADGFRGSPVDAPIGYTDNPFERQADDTARKVVASQIQDFLPARFVSERRRLGQGSGSIVHVQRKEEEKLPPGKYVRLPKSVVQFDQMSCWAAATEAWSPLVPGREKLTQDELIGRFATDVDTGALNPECATNDPEERCFPRFASAMGIDYKDVFVNEVSATYLIERLMKGPVLVIFNVVVNGPSHAIVIYGVGRPEGKELKISFMDPADGSYQNLSVFEFRQLLAGPGARFRIRRPQWVTPPTPGHPEGTFARVKVGWVGTPPTRMSGP